MSKRRYEVSKWIGLLVLISLIFSGCSSLEYDITPPPAAGQSEQFSQTTQPTQTPAQDAVPPDAPLPPDDLGSEAIVVNLVDHTDGVLLEDGLEIELAVYDDYELVYQDVSPLNTSGWVLFEDAPFQAGLVYFASISYGGAIYRSEIIELSAESTSLELTIQIFDTTTSEEALLIDRVHIIVDEFSPDYIQIVEIFIMSNLGDATVVAESPGEPTVSFPLPDDAESIEFEDGSLGQRYLLTENGFGDTVSIPPGSGVYQVLVYYLLPVRRNKIDFSQEMGYPVQAVIAMTPAGDISLKKSTLEDRGTQAIPDATVQVYSGGSIARNESLDFQISIEDSSGEGLADSPKFLSRTIIIGVGVFGAAVLLAGVFLFFNQRRRDDIADKSVDTAASQEEILDSLIALEDLFREGEISEEAYLKKRQELQKQLADQEDGIS